MKKPNVKRSKLQRLLAATLTLSLCVPTFATTLSASAIKQVDDEHKLGANAGKYYSAFSSKAELRAETKEKNVELVAESVALLKNGGGENGDENKLPYTDMKKVSLFGVASWKYGYGGTGSGSGTIERVDDNLNGEMLGDIYHSLEKEGVQINPALKALYMKEYPNGSPSAIAKWNTPSYGDDEVPVEKYTAAIQATYPTYDDAALIFINRLGGESADLGVEGVGGHADATDHYLELTDKEEAMIEHVTANFDKVVVIYNAGNVFEMRELAANPKIDAILNIGQTGDYGFDAVLKILKGEVNPSGKLVDIIPADFTTDPVFQNFGTGAQTTDARNNYQYSNGAKEVEYEEGIYLGYKYYETIYDEIKKGNIDLTADATKAVLGSKDLGDTFADADDWYAKSVTYPYGFGLSYTNFEWTNMTTTVEGTGKDMTFKVTVDVTNKGDYAGKDVVEIYMSAPYTAGGIEKAAAQLVGYAKTPMLKSGASTTVTVEFDAYDIAAYDYSDANGNDFAGYEIEAGTYEFTARTDSHNVVLSKTTDLEAVKVETSQATGAKIENQFVKGKEGAKHNYSSLSPTMTILSREDMIDTFPVAPTADDLNLAVDADKVNPLALDAEGNAKEYAITKAEITYKNGYGYIFGRDNEVNEAWNVWAADEKVIPDNWTQAADNKGEVKYMLSDMMGISPRSDVVLTEADTDVADFVGLTGRAAWDLFMNQLTYLEMQQLNGTGFFKTLGITRIGKPETVDADGPSTIGGQTKDGYTGNRGVSGTRYWASSTNLTMTWNLEFAHEWGTLVGEEAMWNGYNGWYAPSMNIHRSPFSGRNFEYYSQDGTQSGLVAAAVVSGVSSRGVFPYIKHFAVNDQEQDRNGIYTWADEQTIREIYLKPFQYAVEGGNSGGIMTAFNRIGTEGCTDHYPMLTGILREEWGFDGTIVTDYQVGNVGNALNNFEIMTRSGNNIPLSDKNTNSLGGGAWDATLRDGKGGVKATYAAKEATETTPADEWITMSEADKARSCDIQYYYTRIRAEELLYTTARSNAMDNGYDFANNFKSQTVYVAANSSAKAVFNFGADAEPVYSVASSNLPEGLSFNAATATFTAGRNVAKGLTGSVKLNVNLDGWATNVLWHGRDAQDAITVTVVVGDPVVFEGSAIATKDVAFSAKIAQTAYIANPNLGAQEAGCVSAEATATGLPAGLTFDPETSMITGTPTEEGTFEFTVTYNVTMRTVSYNWWGGMTVRDRQYTYNYTFPLIVGEGYKVTFTGVAGYVDTVKYVAAGEKVAEIAAPVAPEGKVFSGWTSGGAAFDFNTPITANTTLTAKFDNAPAVADIAFRVQDGKIQASFQGGAWVDVANVADLKGEAGADGADGATPTVSISEDGFWVINGVKTEVKAQGPAGEPGAPGAPGEQGPEGPAGKDAEGCGSVVGSAVAMVTLLAGAFVVLKKRED